jgi:DNA-binding CsgD family transcriptional regulator/tetratricopeptide (TPR) repeat protein
MDPSATPVRGRDRELAVIDAVIEHTSRGRSGALVLEGPPGIGKSRLVDEACRRAAGAGLSVGSATALELGELAPLGCFLDLVSSTTPSIIGFEELGEVDGATDPRLALLGRLQDAIEARARRAPVTLAIDDLQWADELSVLAVANLARQLASYPVTWIVARRTRPTTPLIERCVARLVDEGATVLALEPLDDPAVDALVSDLAGTDRIAPTRELVGLAGGNPFYISEMLRETPADAIDLGERGDRSAAAVVPAVVEQSVIRRLRSVSADVREIVDIASVFGRRFAVADIAAMLEQPASQLAGRLSEALDEGIFVDEDGDLAFRHDLVRLVVYEALPGSLRQAFHRDAARVLMDAGRSAIDAAPHLSLGARPGDVVAIDLLSSAATEIAGRTPLAAIDLHRRLLELTPDDDPRRSEIAVTLVYLLSLSGSVDEALALADSMLERGLDPLMETIVLVASAMAAELVMRHDIARRYANRALGASGMPELDLQSRLVEAAIATFSGDSDRALRACQAIAVDAADAGFVSIQKDAVALQAHVVGQLGDAGASLELAVEANALAAVVNDPNSGSDPVPARVQALYCLDRFDEARAFIAGGRRLAESHGASWLLFYEQYAVQIEVGVGALADADTLARGAIDLIDELGIAGRLPDFLHLRAQVALRRGELAECRALVNTLDELVGRGASTQALGMNTIAGRYAHAEGDARAALAHLAHVYERPSDLLMHQFCDAPLAAELVRIAIDAGARARSDAVVQCVGEFARLNPTVASIRGSACHAVGLFDDDVDALEEAVAWYRTSGRPLWLAAGLEDLFALKAGGADRDTAGAVLEEALELYFACGADRDTRRTRATLRAVGIRRRLRTPSATPATGWDALSQAEREVAHLVVDGLTNRAIAERLFLSPHTVATHLKHIFLKLDIHSRVELVRLVP